MVFGEKSAVMLLPYLVGKRGDGVEVLRRGRFFEFQIHAAIILHRKETSQVAAVAKSRFRTKYAYVYDVARVRCALLLTARGLMSYN